MTGAVDIANQTADGESRAAAGLRDWTAWLLASLFFFYAFATRVAPSVMVEELMRDFAVGAAILGNLSAFYFYAYAALQIPIGILLDRFGARRLLSAGAAVAGAGCALFAVSDGVPLAYLGRFLIGAGAAVSWVGALTVIAQHFAPRRFASLAGGTQALGMLGAIAGQAPLGFVVGAYGWRTGMYVLAATGLVLAPLLFLATGEQSQRGRRAISTIAGLRMAMANRQTWLCGLFGMAMVGPMVAFGGLWAVPYLIQVHGMDRASAAGITSFMFLAWAVGSPALGGLSDRFGRRRAIMAAGAIAATVLLAALPLLTEAPAAALAALMAATGVVSSCYVVGIALARESNPPAISGTVLGLVNTCVIASGALLQPFIGFILDQLWDGASVDGARQYSPHAYHLALAVLPLVCGLGSIAALSVRDTAPRAAQSLR